MRGRLLSGLVVRGLLFAAAACSDSDEAPASCPIGTEACPCTSGGACDPGLVCLSNLCVARPGSGTDGGVATPTPAAGGGTSVGPQPDGGNTAAETGSGGGNAAPGGAAGSLVYSDYNCLTYCAAARNQCSLDQAGEDACRADCEAMYETHCADGSYWYLVMKCGSDAAAWTCTEGKASLSGCQTEREAYTECMNSELCAAVYQVVGNKCSLSSSVLVAAQLDCENRLRDIDRTYPLCKGLAVAGWMCAANPDVWVCNGTSSATRTGCTIEASELSACLTAGSPDTGAALTCGSYEPCCELCDTQCTGASGTHIESYKQCLTECISCCTRCDL